MKKILNFFKSFRALILLLICFIVFDTVLAHFMTNFITYSGYIWRNDYELTVQQNPQKVWDKVFFGSSVVISAYREDLSNSDYVNLGLDYGVVTDLEKMIKRKDIKIGSELVIGLNYLTLYDNLDTNPTYPWNRKFLEPYSYFRRDTINITLKTFAKDIILGQETVKGQENQTKIYYYGCLSESEIQERLQTYKELYWNADISEFDNNFKALEQIKTYCEQNNISLRIVWLPVNPDIQMPELDKTLFDKVQQFCKDNNIELLDMQNTLSSDCFYDVWHINREYGSYRFMEVIEPWLNS